MVNLKYPVFSIVKNDNMIYVFYNDKEKKRKQLIQKHLNHSDIRVLPLLIPKA
jgi:hypothetical protein